MVCGFFKELLGVVGASADLAEALASQRARWLGERGFGDCGSRWVWVKIGDRWHEVLPRYLFVERERVREALAVYKTLVKKQKFYITALCRSGDLEAVRRCLSREIPYNYERVCKVEGCAVYWEALGSVERLREELDSLLWDYMAYISDPGAVYKAGDVVVVEGEVDYPEIFQSPALVFWAATSRALPGNPYVLEGD